jgi:hypothetical protein
VKLGGSTKSEFYPSSEGAGSYFSGGFGHFPIAAGEAAGASWKMPGPGGKDAVAAQIAAIRSTPWDLITESDLRLLGVRIAIAREWIVQAALRPEAFQALTSATVGLLSLARRADLINGINARDWGRVWEAVTVPDLFSLGAAYPEYFKQDLWHSPLTREFRTLSATDQPDHLQALGALPYLSLGCDHPHWMPMAPYEEYEHRFFPGENAERWAEFKLFLAFDADVAGVDIAQLSSVAEKLAARAFASAQMADFHDWRSLLNAYASISTSDLNKALEP